MSGAEVLAYGQEGWALLRGFFGDRSGQLLMFMLVLLVAWQMTLKRSGEIASEVMAEGYTLEFPGGGGLKPDRSHQLVIVEDDTICESTEHDGVRCESLASAK